MYVLCGGSSYEQGHTGGMAEEGSVCELEGLKTQLQSLFSRYASDELRADSKPFCSDFCKLVETHASRWQVPLPQLRILETALCYFAQASIFFTSNCDHVLHTLSSLALSVFELLLFFDQKDFTQEPLTHFTVTFQECHSALTRHQNVHLLQVERLVRGGGPWAGPALQAILTESSLPQSEVDGCIGSEPPVFLELRVRYLLSHERVHEAMALAKCCARHPVAGQHLFFLQVYLTWLFKTLQHDRLHKEVAEFNGKDAVHIICSLECEEEDELLLALSRAFLSQQLRRGDMYYLCDLVFIWSRLHSRLKTSKQDLLEESRQLMLLATNVNSIFPFIRAILQELGDDGIQFCVELCTNALGSCLPCDVLTKSLIYKTIAGLLPNDLEVSRACALLVFFLERTIEAYKMVYLLYMHPDQEYHVEQSPIRNHVRFEMLQVLKKDLYFDPEFWNLIALRTKCVKLMSEKVTSSALEEIMEDKWILNYCTKEPSTSACQKGRKRLLAKKQQHKDGTDTTSKRLKGKTRLIAEHAGRKKGSQGSSEPLRRSFWQLDRLQDTAASGELRRTTRLSEKNPPKRRIRQPKWLVEDSGTPGGNNVLPKMKRHRKHHGASVMKRPQTAEVKNNAKHSANSKDSLPQVVLELSLPDNELLGTFTDDACHRQRGIPQVLFYRSTVKLPVVPQPAKTIHGKEVILRARDAAMFTQQLHCYARRPKGKGSGPNIHVSVSTITRSSVQGSPPKEPQSELSEKPVAETKAGITAQTDAEFTKSPVFTKASEREPSAAETSAETPILDKVRQLCDESAVEMKVTIASTAKATPPLGLDEAPKTPKTTTSAEVLQTSAADSYQKEVTDKISPVSSDPTPSQSKTEGKPLSDTAEVSRIPSKGHTLCENDTTSAPSDQDSVNNISALTLVTEMVAELPPETLTREPENHKVDGAKEEPKPEGKAPQKLLAASSCSVVAQMEVEEDDPDLPECEESKLEYCCTFCTKIFKGSRVVVHAMFHYRKDECMFCGTVFKDDLLAMMHLSDHIEKLKKICNGVQETKDAAQKTTAKAKTSNVHRSRGRPRKTSESGPRLASPGSRQLRSNGKPADPPNPKTPSNKVNGHIGKKKELEGPRKDPEKRKEVSQVRIKARAEKSRLRENSSDLPKKPESQPGLKMSAKPSDKDLEPQEKVCCPVDSCGWFTDLSKNRVALLYHALQDHYGVLKPLELAFRVGNGKCSCCMRVMWSFEHFQHHVERHRLTPRHPCLHRGCSDRFKTGIEMRRHTRRHSPLQAACCLPGCSKLFICLWALNLHEREHYAAKASKPDKNTSEQESGTPEKQATAAVNQTTSEKAARKASGKQAPPPSTEEDSHVLKNLSNKDTSAQPTGPNLRLRQRLRSRKVSASLLKRRIKTRHKFKKKQDSGNTRGPKRRGRPPKQKKDVHDENTGQKDQPLPPPSPPPPPPQPQPPTKAAETSNVNDEVKEEEKPQQVPETTSASKENHLKHDHSPETTTDDSLNKPISTTTDKLPAKKLHKVKKRSESQASPEAGKSKKHKVANTEAKISKKIVPQDNAKGEIKDFVVPADGSDVSTATPINSGEQIQDQPTKKPKVKKEGRKEKSVSSDLGKTNKKDEDKNKDKEKTKRDASKKSLKKKAKLKCVEADVASPDVEGRAKEATASSSPAATEENAKTPAPPAATQKEKPRLPKSSDPNKAVKKRKSVHKEGDSKVTKKRCKDHSEKPPKSEVIAVVKAEAVEEVKTSTVSSLGYSIITNGQASRDDAKPTVLKDVLAGYSNRPYVRPPPTAYLDEKYITMPKRRKELSSLQKSPPLQQNFVAKALQRQRCANCFATFDSAEELQSHLQLKKCSNVFGFDSDDEGNGFTCLI